MKQRRLLRAVLLPILVLSIPLALAALSYVRAVRLSLVEGQVWVSRPASVAPEKALVNLPLVQDAVLETGDGFAEVEFESGLYARLAAYSRLGFEELALADNGGRLTTLLLADGTATFSSDLGRQDSLRVRTPFFEVLVPRRARFRLDRTDAGARVRVFSGQVEVETPQGRTAVSKGRMFEWEEAAQSYTLLRNPARDEWDAWNEERDNALEVAAHAAVPAHLRYGLYDLHRFGQWTYLPSFGHVWRPWVGAGWLPFSYGHWSLYPGFGWTWVSYEPWGWLPYHYGGWYYDPFWGWVWVPGYFNAWSPARCYWVRRGGWIGWGPLGPDDQPVATASGGSSLPPGGGSRGGPAPREDVPPAATLVVSEEGFARGEIARPVREVLGREAEQWSITREPPARLARFGLADVIERTRPHQAAGTARPAPASEAEGSTPVPRRQSAPRETEGLAPSRTPGRDAAGETRVRPERLPAPRIPAALPRLGETTGRAERQSPERTRPEGRSRDSTSPRPAQGASPRPPPPPPRASQPPPPPRPAPSAQPPRPSPPPPPPPREKPPPPPRPEPPA